MTRSLRPEPPVGANKDRGNKPRSFTMNLSLPITNPYKPPVGKGLDEIFMDVGLKLKFRVRHIRTYNDYLILAVHQWAFSVISKPAVMKAYSFMSGNEIFCEADNEDYVLLSTRDEVIRAQRYKSEALIKACENAYNINEPVVSPVAWRKGRYRPFGYDRYEE